MQKTISKNLNTQKSKNNNKISKHDLMSLSLKAGYREDYTKAREKKQNISDAALNDAATRDNQHKSKEMFKNLKKYLICTAAASSLVLTSNSAFATSDETNSNVLRTIPENGQRRDFLKSIRSFATFKNKKQKKSDSAPTVKLTANETNGAASHAVDQKSKRRDILKSIRSFATSKTNTTPKSDSAPTVKLTANETKDAVSPAVDQKSKRRDILKSIRSFATSKTNTTPKSDSAPTVKLTANETKDAVSPAVDQKVQLQGFSTLSSSKTNTTPKSDNAPTVKLTANETKDAILPAVLEIKSDAENLVQTTLETKSDGENTKIGSKDNSNPIIKNEIPNSPTSQSIQSEIIGIRNHKDEILVPIKIGRSSTQKDYSKKNAVKDKIDNAKSPKGYHKPKRLITPKLKTVLETKKDQASIILLMKQYNDTQNGTLYLDQKTSDDSLFNAISINLRNEELDISVKEDSVISGIYRDYNENIDTLKQSRSLSKRLSGMKHKLNKEIKNLPSRLSSNGNNSPTANTTIKKFKKAKLTIEGAKDVGEKDREVFIGRGTGEGDFTALGDIDMLKGRSNLTFRSNYFSNKKGKENVYTGQILGASQKKITVDTDMVFAPGGNQRKLNIKQLEIAKNRKVIIKKDINTSSTDNDDEYNIDIKEGATLILKGKNIHKKTNKKTKGKNIARNFNLKTNTINAEEGSAMKIADNSHVIWTGAQVSDQPGKTENGMKSTRYDILFNGVESNFVVGKNAIFEIANPPEEDALPSSFFDVKTNVTIPTNSTYKIGDRVNFKLSGSFNKDFDKDDSYANIILGKESALELTDGVFNSIIKNGKPIDDKTGKNDDDSYTVISGNTSISGQIDTKIETKDTTINLVSDLTTTNNFEAESATFNFGTEIIKISPDADNKSAAYDFVFGTNKHHNKGKLILSGNSIMNVGIDGDNRGGISSSQKNIDISALESLTINFLIQNPTKDEIYLLDGMDWLQDQGNKGLKEELKGKCELGKCEILADGYNLNKEKWMVTKNSDKNTQPLRRSSIFVEPEQPPVEETKPASITTLTRDSSSLERVLKIAQKPIGTLSSAVTSRSVDISSVAIAAGDGDEAAHANFVKKERGVWITPFIGKATQKLYEGVSGYTSRSSGVTFGADFDITERLSMGLALGLMDTKFKFTDNRQDEHKVNTTLYSVYGTYDLPKNWFAQGMLSYGDSKIKYSEARVKDENGAITESASGEFKTKSYGAELLFGRNIKLRNNRMVLTPILGARYTQFKESNQRDFGEDEFTLNIGDRKISKFEGIAGLRASSTIQKGDIILTPEFDAIVNYKFSENKSLLSATSNSDGKTVLASSEESSKTMLNLGTALTLQKGIFEFKLEYDAYLAKKYVGHQGALKIKLHL